MPGPASASVAARPAAIALASAVAPTAVAVAATLTTASVAVASASVAAVVHPGDGHRTPEWRDRRDGHVHLARR